MEKSMIDFTDIANINYSNKSQSSQTNNENYINDNILLFRNDEGVIDKKEAKINNKIQFEKTMIQIREKFKSLSLKTSKIINSKNFSFKIILKNNLNSQSFTEKEKIIINKNGSNSSNISNENNININNSNNQFKIVDNSFNIFFKKSNEKPNLQKIIGKKRENENNNNMNIMEKEKNIFNEILITCHEISNFNNDIIKKEEQNNIDMTNENIETTLIINNNPIVTIYFNGDEINKIYDFNNKKIIINENDILSHLKQIKKKMNIILNKLKKV
jgi:hypothetical protein